MREIDLESIEYKNFLNLISSYTYNSLTKKAIISLKPFKNLAKLQKEIKKLMNFFHFLSIKDTYLSQIILILVKL